MERDAADEQGYHVTGKRKRLLIIACSIAVIVILSALAKLVVFESILSDDRTGRRPAGERSRS